MKFKNTKKTTSTKTTASPETKEEKETALKEEIREIVEETVDDVLKEKAEKGELPLSSVKDTQSEPDNVESVAKEDEVEAKDTQLSEAPMPEASKVIQPQEVPVVEPVAVNEAAAPTPSAPEQPIEEPKTEVVPPTTPVANVMGTPSAEPDSDITETTEEVSKKSSFMRVILLLLILLLLGGGGYWYLSSNNMLSLPGMTTEKKTTPSKAVEPTAVPTEAKVDVSKYTISVLNGSGVAGQAANVKSDLSDAGFNVTNTGNADTSDVTDTTIAVKSSVEKAYIEKLTKELEKSYVVSSDIKTLDDSESADVVVTIGSNTK